MIESDPVPALPLGYAVAEGVPGQVLARVVVWAMTAYAGLNVLGAGLSAVSMFALVSSPLPAMVNSIPSLLAGLPVVVMGPIVLMRGASRRGFVVVLWIYVAVRAVGAVLGSVVSAWSILSSGAGGPTRSLGYVLPNSVAQVLSAAASLVLPLLAIWILCRPELRGNSDAV